MDGSPRVTDVTFDQVKRGYDPEQVDTYLEELDQVVVELRRNWRDALDRADSLEATLAQLSTKVEAGEETVGRTLLLAQKAADQALEDAKKEAKAIVDNAGKEVALLLAEANGARDKAKKEAEQEARSLVDEAKALIDREIEEVRTRRDTLRQDVELLEQHLATQRARLRSAISEIERLVEIPEAFRVEEAPMLKSVSTREASAATASQGPTDDEPSPRGGQGRSTISGSASQASASGRKADGPVSPTPPRSPDSSIEARVEPKIESPATSPSPSQGSGSQAPSARFAPPAPEEKAPDVHVGPPVAPTAGPAGDASGRLVRRGAGQGARSGNVTALPVKQYPDIAAPESGTAPGAEAQGGVDRATREGPDTASHPASSHESEGSTVDAIVADLNSRRPAKRDDDGIDESFLEELQRAVNDDGGLPALDDEAQDEAMRAFFDADLSGEQRPRSRFGRRG